MVEAVDATAVNSGREEHLDTKIQQMNMDCIHRQLSDFATLGLKQTHFEVQTDLS